MVFLGSWLFQFLPLEVKEGEILPQSVAALFSEYSSVLHRVTTQLFDSFHEGWRSHLFL